MAIQEHSSVVICFKNERVVTWESNRETSSRLVKTARREKEIMSRESSPSLLNRRLQEKLEEILQAFQHHREGLLPALKIVQDETGNLDPACIRFLSHRLRLPESTIYGTGTFYSLHTTHKLGLYTIRVCNSIVCYSQQGKSLLRFLEGKLSLKPGETTPDGIFSLEETECLGACDRSPVMMVNEATHFNVTKEFCETLIDRLRREGQSDTADGDAT